MPQLCFCHCCHSSTPLLLHTVESTAHLQDWLTAAWEVSQPAKCTLLKKKKKMGQRKQTCLLRHCNQHFRWSLQTKCPFFSYFLKFISLYWFVGFMFTETMQTYHIWSSLRSWVILSFGHVSLEVMADWFAWIVADFCECLLIVDWPCDGEFSLVQCEQCWPYIVLILTD